MVGQAGCLVFTEVKGDINTLYGLPLGNPFRLSVANDMTQWLRNTKGVVEGDGIKFETQIARTTDLVSCFYSLPPVQLRHLVSNKRRHSSETRESSK